MNGYFNTIEVMRFDLIQSETAYIRVYHPECTDTVGAYNLISNYLSLGPSIEFESICTQPNVIVDTCYDNGGELDEIEILAIIDCIIRKTKNLMSVNDSRLKMFILGFIQRYKGFRKEHTLEDTIKAEREHIENKVLSHIRITSATGFESTDYEYHKAQVTEELGYCLREWILAQKSGLADMTI